MFLDDFSIGGKYFEEFGDGVDKVFRFKLGPSLGEVTLYGERGKCA